MKNERRLFLSQMSVLAAAAALSKPLTATASVAKRINTLHSTGHEVTVYSTNDLHGNLGDWAGGKGGLNKIKALLKDQETNGLLFDAGDFLNSAHNVSRQKEVIYAMNNMGYLAAAIGDNELSLGQDHLAALIPLMQFNLLNCNYGFEGPLNKLVKQYIIINSGKYKIGVTGVGHQVKGVKYNDAIASANRVARLLKEDEKCDLVICLSHLGYSQKNGYPDNQELAAQSLHIDMIVSGHNRTLLKGPAILLNKQKKEVVVSQAAWDGIMMGKTVFSFDNKQKRDVKAKYFITGLSYGQTYAASFAELRAAEQRLVSA